MKRRQIHHILCNTLDGLANRNADFDGWYLWGQVRRSSPSLSLQLLPPTFSDNPLHRAVLRHVTTRLQRQLALLPSHDIADARLVVAEACDGLDLTIEVKRADGQTYAAQRWVVANPHDPQKEQRSTRREPT